MKRKAGLITTLVFVTHLGATNQLGPELERGIARSNPQAVTITLTPSKSVFRLGEQILVKAQLNNKSDQTILIGIGRSFSNGTSRLTITVEDHTGVHHPKWRGAVDFVGRMEFTEAVVRELAALPPGYFFGRTFSLECGDFDVLCRPGKFRIHATYKADPFIDDAWSNPLLPHLGKVRALPYPAWVGEIEAEAWVEIARGHEP